ncbi:MAG: hypothetical protein LBF69_04080 [Prevotellaceae bacterium]|jgi:hypothetical protein|nr:hypothetical protein [Prevotellaceae bacterium]
MMDDVRTDRETKMTQKDTDKCASRDKAASRPEDCFLLRKLAVAMTSASREIASSS